MNLTILVKILHCNPPNHLLPFNREEVGQTNVSLQSQEQLNIDTLHLIHPLSELKSNLRSPTLSIPFFAYELTVIHPSQSLGFGAKDFWEWDNLFSYVKFLLLFTFLIGLLTYILLDNHMYIETLGFVAVFTESMLGMPQLLRNYSKKSTRGMSVAMVMMWLSGDLFKTLYFVIRRAPAQFYVCSSIQVVVDLLILAQVLLYRLPNVAYRKLPKST